MAVTHAAKEAVWLRCLKGELLTPTVNLTIIYCDNQVALKLATDNNYQARTKHIDICFYFICQVISAGELSLIYCPTDDMTANILTKALPAWKVTRHITRLGIHQGPTVLVGECWGNQIVHEEELAAKNGMQCALGP
jgi:hypothetical protein